jgi:hypothetical protein
MADPTTLSWSVLDDEGLKNTISMYVAYDALTATVDQVENAWLEYGALINPCIDGMITGGAITIPQIPGVGGTWKTAPASGNNVNQVMNLNFLNDFNSYVTEFLLPSYSESILTPTLVPDLANTNLAALIAAILFGAPPITPAVFPNSRDLHDLNALKDAFLTVRKVRNQKRHTVVTP